jgi:hypothetical protein
MAPIAAPPSATCASNWGCSTRLALHIFTPSSPFLVLRYLRKA